MPESGSMNLFDYLLENADLQRIALIEEGATTSYGELLRMVEGVEHALKTCGTGFQEKVGILAENSAFWVACYLGIIKSGAVAAPLPSRLTADDLENYTKLIRCRTLCIDDRLVARYERLITESGNQVLKSAIMPFKTRGSAPDTESRPITASVDSRKDLAALMFTSGSTGQPNAVRVTHQNIMANTGAIIAYLDLSQDDRMMTVLPFHYCFGTSLLHTHLRAGGSLVINNYFQYVEDVLNEMETFSCTGLAGVPSTFQSLLNNKSFRGRRFATLRHVQQAGGKLADRYIEDLRSILHGDARLFISYGQTEATARLSYLPPEKLQKKTGSIGKGIPGVTLQIVDQTGIPLEQGEIGEIVAEGDNVAAGYLLPDPAKNPFRNGKLYTGDLGYTDEDGYIYLVGREKDFIKPSGYKVMTATIENVLLELPEIADAAVVGVPHDQLGEAAKAFIVLNDNALITAETILDHCRKKLPLYAVPCCLEFMNHLPKNSAGKVMKNSLKQTP